MYDGQVNGRGENRQKFLKEMMRLSPVLHAAGIVGNRENARKAGFQNVEDAVNKRLDRAANIEKGKALAIDKWVCDHLFGVADEDKKQVPRLVPVWAEKRIRQGKKWPLTLLGYKVVCSEEYFNVSPDGEAKMVPATVVAIYRWWVLKVGQRFVWEGNSNAGFN